MKTRFTDELIVGFLRQVESGGKTVAEVCRDGGFSQPTFYVWKRRLGSMAEPEVEGGVSWNPSTPLRVRRTRG